MVSQSKEGKVLVPCFGIGIPNLAGNRVYCFVYALKKCQLVPLQGVAKLASFKLAVHIKEPMVFQELLAFG